ncbi:phosphate regulon sensor histidine kinase PhoR [Rhizobium sp. CFBP 8762]|uniref:phosphate regulon sensor histidine kinase PhoR n=1 Tax=Rhizobium sp. CFBP 8762 TaxID=2775279 RepID=UPI00406BE4E5
MTDWSGTDWLRHSATRLWREKIVLMIALLVAALALWNGVQPTAVVFGWLAIALAVLFGSTEPLDDRVVVRSSPPISLPVLPARPSLDAALAILNAMDMPVLIVGADETLRLQNLAAEKLFGHMAVGTYLSTRVRDPDVLDMVRGAMAEGAVGQMEHVSVSPLDSVHIVRIAPVICILSDGSRERLFALSYRDVSQARRMEKMRSDFVANASHELRTPLASLRGFIETLQGPARNDPKARDRFLSIMHEQATRMSRLVDDLLSLSRLELKAHIPPDEDIDLAPLIASVRDALTPLAEEVNVSIDLHLPDQPLIVRGDRDELTQVFENLIENACKYGQEGGKVDVILSTSGPGHGDVLVRDYGPGIPQEYVPRITERFYRVNVEASRSKKGTGLGLAIVKHILTRHRARLVVQSDTGKGASFTVRF